MRTLPRVDAAVVHEIESLCAPGPVREFMRTFTREAFEEMVNKCPSIGFEIDDHCVGGAFMFGNRVHISVHPEYQSQWRNLYPDFIDWMFSICDPAYGVVHVDNAPAARFVTRGGGVRVGTIELNPMGSFDVYAIHSGPVRQRKLYQRLKEAS